MSKNVDICSCDSVGGKRTMEDSFVQVQQDRAALAAVFDGHSGFYVSMYLQNEFVATLLKEGSASDLSELGSKTPEHASSLLEKALWRIDQHVINDSMMRYQGSTALVAWFHQHDEGVDDDGQDGKSSLILANIGDCRAVLGRALDRGRASDKWEAVALTRDHRPHDPLERKRIEGFGGHVEMVEDWFSRVNGGFAVARSIGTASERPFMNAEPDLTIVPIVDNHDDSSDAQEFVILGSDGLWDMIKNDEAVQFVVEKVRDGMPRGKIPGALIDHVKDRAWDNITVQIAWLLRGRLDTCAASPPLYTPPETD